MIGRSLCGAGLESNLVQFQFKEQSSCQVSGWLFVVVLGSSWGLEGWRPSQMLWSVHWKENLALRCLSVDWLIEWGSTSIEPLQIMQDAHVIDMRKARYDLDPKTGRESLWKSQTTLMIESVFEKRPCCWGPPPALCEKQQMVFYVHASIDTCTHDQPLLRQLAYTFVIMAGQYVHENAE